MQGTSTLTGKKLRFFKFPARPQGSPLQYVGMIRIQNVKLKRLQHWDAWRKSVTMHPYILFRETCRYETVNFTHLFARLARPSPAKRTLDPLVRRLCSFMD